MVSTPPGYSRVFLHIQYSLLPRPSVISQLKRIAARFSPKVQSTLKRVHYARQIRSGEFRADEPEARILHEFVKPGDWAIDVGANIGHYTVALAGLVGAQGRVIAFEPILSTFALLAHNVDLIRSGNVSLVNAAASESFSVLGMTVPTIAETGLDNPYMAQISEGGGLKVIGLRIDALEIQGPVRFVKIDAEGHELSVLQGMRGLLERNRPVLIVEGGDSGVEMFLRDLGYRFTVLPGSWNRIYRFEKTTETV